MSKFVGVTQETDGREVRYLYTEEEFEKELKKNNVTELSEGFPREDKGATYIEYLDNENAVSEYLLRPAHGPFTDDLTVDDFDKYCLEINSGGKYGNGLAGAFLQRHDINPGRAEDNAAGWMEGIYQNIYHAFDVPFELFRGVNTDNLSLDFGKEFSLYRGIKISDIFVIVRIKDALDKWNGEFDKDGRAYITFPPDTIKQDRTEHVITERVVFAKDKEDKITFEIQINDKVKNTPLQFGRHIRMNELESEGASLICVQNIISEAIDKRIAILARTTENEKAWDAWDKKKELKDEAFLDKQKTESLTEDERELDEELSELER